jgi:hypothetical protein
MARDKMTLQSAGAYGGQTFTFPHNPASAMKIHPKRRIAKIDTYGSSAVFDWWFLDSLEAERLIGTRVTLSWPYINNSFWRVLMAFYESEEEVIWDPGDIYAHASGKKYSIVPTALTSLDMAQNASHKSDVKMELEIRGIAT